MIGEINKHVVLIGFGHQHLSGTGIGDLGDVAFLPVTDAMHLSERSFQSTHGRLCKNV